MSVIRKKRVEMKIPQKEMCKALGISQSTLSMWETGASRPSSHRLIGLADYFHCTVDELLDRPAAGT